MLRRSERRLIRPFPSVNEILKDVGLRVRPTDEFAVEEAHIEVDDATLGEIDVECRLQPLDIDALKRQYPDLAPSMVLGIVLTDHGLKRSWLVFKCPIDDVPELWRLPPDVRNQLSWTGPTQLSVFVMLGKAAGSVQRGKPYRLGHWVARKDFSIGVAARQPAFPIERWEPDVFQRRGLPRRTTYYVDVDEDALLNEGDELRSAIRVGLHASVFDSLRLLGRSPIAKGLQAWLAAEVVAEVLFRGLQSLNGSAPPDESLIASLVRKLESTQLPADALIEAARNGNYSTVRAAALAFMELTSYLVDATR